MRAAIASWRAGDATYSDEATSTDLPEAVARATALGVVISSSGTEDRPTAGGLRPPEPDRHLLSGFLAQAASKQYANFLANPGTTEEHPHRTRTRLRSAAGPDAGK